MPEERLVCHRRRPSLGELALGCRRTSNRFPHTSCHCMHHASMHQASGASSCLGPKYAVVHVFLWCVGYVAGRFPQVALYRSRYRRVELSLSLWRIPRVRMSGNLKCPPDLYGKDGKHSYSTAFLQDQSPSICLSDYFFALVSLFTFSHFRSFPSTSSSFPRLNPAPPPH